MYLNLFNIILSSIPNLLLPLNLIHMKYRQLFCLFGEVFEMVSVFCARFHRYCLLRLFHAQFILFSILNDEGPPFFLPLLLRSVLPAILLFLVMSQQFVIKRVSRWQMLVTLHYHLVFGFLFCDLVLLVLPTTPTAEKQQATAHQQHCSQYRQY